MFKAYFSFLTWQEVDIIRCQTQILQSPSHRSNCFKKTISKEVIKVHIRKDRLSKKLNHILCYLHMHLSSEDVLLNLTLLL